MSITVPASLQSDPTALASFEDDFTSSLADYFGVPPSQIAITQVAGAQALAPGSVNDPNLTSAPAAGELTSISVNDWLGVPCTCCCLPCRASLVVAIHAPVLLVLPGPPLAQVTFSRRRLFEGGEGATASLDPQPVSTDRARQLQQTSTVDIAYTVTQFVDPTVADYSDSLQAAAAAFVSDPLQALGPGTAQALQSQFNISLSSIQVRGRRRRGAPCCMGLVGPHGVHPM